MEVKYCEHSRNRKVETVCYILPDKVQAPSGMGLWHSQNGTSSICGALPLCDGLSCTEGCYISSCLVTFPILGWINVYNVCGKCSAPSHQCMSHPKTYTWKQVISSDWVNLRKLSPVGKRKGDNGRFTMFSNLTQFTYKRLREVVFRSRLVSVWELRSTWCSWIIRR